MSNRESISQLLDELSKSLSRSRDEVLLSALELLHETMRLKAAGEMPKAIEVLQCARDLFEEEGPFTMDELVDHIYQDTIILNCHASKIYFGQLLSIGGFERKQVRREGQRPNVWMPA